MFSCQGLSRLEPRQVSGILEVEPVGGARPVVCHLTREGAFADLAGAEHCNDGIRSKQPAELFFVSKAVQQRPCIFSGRRRIFKVANPISASSIEPGVSLQPQPLLVRTPAFTVKPIGSTARWPSRLMTVTS